MSFTKEDHVYESAQYLKAIYEEGAGSGKLGGGQEIVGSQSLDGSNQTTYAIKPSSNGVEGDSCEIVIRNIGSATAWLNSDQNSTDSGLPILSEDGYVKDKIKSEDDVHYIHFPNNSGQIELVYWE